MEILQEVGRLKHGDLASTKQVNAVLRDLVEAAITAGAEEGRRTLPLPDGWREAIATVAGREVDVIDKTKLERTGRSRGGYVDVELINKLWVARVPDGEGGTRALSQRFLKPELAAWARYQHFLEHKIPYGKFAKEIEKQRNSKYVREQLVGEGDEEFIRAQAIWSLSIDGVPIDPAFLRSGEDRWLMEEPDFEKVIQVLRFRLLHAKPALEVLAAAPKPTIEQTKQTIAQAQAEADKAREAVLVSSREARAARMAAQPVFQGHGGPYDDDPYDGLDDD